MQTVIGFARAVGMVAPDRDEELRAAYDQLARQEAVLTVCREYFEEASDVIDGDYGVPAPNREMTLLIEIDEVLL